jgi:hypothetical protein
MLMRPGALICTAFGFGRDDLSGFFTYLLANALLYGVAFATSFLVLLGSRK